MAAEKAETVNVWHEDRSAAIPGHLQPAQHFGNTFKIGNSYQGINELYAWPVPLDALGCTARITMSGFRRSLALTS